jgi:hypothetical protein
MNRISMFEPRLITVGWIAISNQIVAIRAEYLDPKKALRTIPFEQYIPLH